MVLKKFDAPARRFIDDMKSKKLECSKCRYLGLLIKTLDFQLYYKQGVYRNYCEYGELTAIQRFKEFMEMADCATCIHSLELTSLIKLHFQEDIPTWFKISE